MSNYTHKHGNAAVGGCGLETSRVWRREIDSLPDEELMRVVRGMTAVDRAVDGYRGRPGRARVDVLLLRGAEASP